MTHNNNNNISSARQLILHSLLISTSAIIILYIHNIKLVVLLRTVVIVTHTQTHRPSSLVLLSLFYGLAALLGGFSSRLLILATLLVIFYLYLTNKNDDVTDVTNRHRLETNESVYYDCHDTDDTLEAPAPAPPSDTSHFYLIKQHYKHILHGYTKQGEPVMWEATGEMQLSNILGVSLSLENMYSHYTSLWDYLISVNNTSFVVMDMRGFSLKSLSKEVLKYLKGAGDIANRRYPNALSGVLVINSPFWISSVWSKVKSILPSKLQASAVIASSDYMNQLREVMEENEIPVEYGGTSPYPLGQHPLELELIRSISGNNSSHNNGTASHGYGNIGDNDEGLEQQQLQSDNTDYKECSLTSTTTITTYTAAATVSSSIRYIIMLLTFLLSVVQGALSVCIPLWLYASPLVGGCGYESRSTGVSIFGACLIFIVFYRTKLAKYLLLHKTVKNPLQAFRISVGALVVLLSLLVTVPAILHTYTRKESIVVSSSIVIVACGIVFAFCLGNESTHELYKAASVGRMRFTRVVGEVSGAALIAPLFVWSTSEHRPFPFDASCSFSMLSIVCCCLYIMSLSLNSVMGELTSSDGMEKEDCAPLQEVNRAVLFRDMLRVPASDVTSIIEGTNWINSKNIESGLLRTKYV